MIPSKRTAQKEHLNRRTIKPPRPYRQSQHSQFVSATEIERSRTRPAPSIARPLPETLIEAGFTRLHPQANSTRHFIGAGAWLGDVFAGNNPSALSQSTKSSGQLETPGGLLSR